MPADCAVRVREDSSEEFGKREGFILLNSYERQSIDGQAGDFIFYTA
jgi:hypothetical protein